MLRPALVATTLSLAVSLPTHAEFSFDIGLGSEYLKNGISLTEGKPTYQTGLTYLNDSGLYGGLWASNIDQSNLDIDYEGSAFAGWYLPLSESLALDAGVTHYENFGGDDADGRAYAEGFAKLLVNDAWTFGLRQSEDFQGTDEAHRSLESAYTYQTGTFSIEFYVAQHRFLKTTETANYGGSRDDYWHFRVGAGRSYNNWDYRLKLERTNLGGDFDAGTAITFSLHRFFNF